MRFVVRHAASLYWMLALIVLSAMLFMFGQEVLSVRRNFQERLLVSIADSMVLLLPYWWLPRRWRGLVLVPLWLMAAFYAGNLLYFRFWGRLLPFMLVTQAGNANGVLVDSAIGVLRASDVVYVLLPTMITLLWCLRPVRKAVMNGKFRLWQRLDASMIAAALFFGAMYVGARQFCSYCNIKDLGVAETFRKYNELSSRPDAYFQSDTRAYFTFNGQTKYLLYQTGTLLSDGHVDLSKDQCAGFAAYCASADPQETALAENRGKNFIFIIVESLNADIVDRRINGREITPNLNALARSPRSVTCLRVRPQIGEGNSADGQLMYNVGLLPTSVYVASADYVPGLYNLKTMAGLLPDSPDRAAIFADPGNGWNKREAYRNYGYDSIFNSDSIRAHTPEGMSRDGAMFRYALERIDSMGRPFHLQLLTIQMHSPYNERVLNFTDYTGLGLTLPQRRYINCTADFDRQLGAFIRGLKDRGVWDNTILVVASDHNAPDAVRADGEPADIVFIAANAGRGERIEEEVHQVDVFPTVLDIMGIEGGWRGVGRSMLGPRRGESDARQAGVSDSLLRSDYFK